MEIKCPTSVAILMAAYNGEKYIREQIESIIAQDTDDWTLYIRDDGSNDDTLKILYEYTESNKKIVLVEGVETTGGLNANFFALLRCVEAPFYMFADQDDVWVCNKIRLSLEKVTCLQKSYPDSMILVGSHSEICDLNLKHISHSFWTTHYVQHKMLNTEMVGVNCPIAGAEMIFNKKLRNEILKYPENNLYYDHWIVYFAVRNKAKIDIIQEELRRYRQHPDNVLGGNIHKNIGKKIIRLFFDYFLLKQVDYGNLFVYLKARLKVFWILKTVRCKSTQNCT